MTAPATSQAQGRRERPMLSVEMLRAEYLYLAKSARFHPPTCPWCAARSSAGSNHWELAADAASIAYDLAVAEASLKRQRDGVAWA